VLRNLPRIWGGVVRPFALLRLLACGSGDRGEVPAYVKVRDCLTVRPHHGRYCWAMTLATSILRAWQLASDEAHVQEHELARRYLRALEGGERPPLPEVEATQGVRRHADALFRLAVDTIEGRVPAGRWH
jgi:hypothetical protein